MPLRMHRNVSGVIFFIVLVTICHTSSIPFVSHRTLADLKKIRDNIKTFETNLKDVEDRLKDRDWKKHNGHCYFFGEESYMWSDAERMCRQIGGYLVKIDDSSENAFLASSIQNTATEHWIGLTDLSEGECRWMYDQQIASYTAFDVSEPNGGKNSNCFLMATSGKWLDRECNDNQRFICENNFCF